MSAALGVTNPDLADTLPPLVELPPGTQLMMHMPFSNGVRKGGAVLAASANSQDQVLAFEREAMARKGLPIRPETSGPKGEIVLLAESDDKGTRYQVAVHPTKKGRTVIQVNYQEPVS